jgi:hypothetical protein
MGALEPRDERAEAVLYKILFLLKYYSLCSTELAARSISAGRSVATTDKG